MLLDDPFLGTGFVEIRQSTVPHDTYDARGPKSVPYDLTKYLERLGPNAALKTFAEFAAATAKENAFEPGGVLSFMPNLPQFSDCLADPTRPPNLSEFIAAKTAYLEIFESVVAEHKLDALVFPQMRNALKPLHGGQRIDETTVSEINIAGLPGVTMPAGYYASGAPFCLISWPHVEQADLLAYAFAYESATKHRRAPVLSRP